jgi:hypothetical protein
MNRQAPTDPTLPSRCPCPAGGAVIAVKPGQDAVRRGAVDIATRRDPLVEAEVPDRVFCRACWPFWREEVAA